MVQIDGISKRIPSQKEGIWRNPKGILLEQFQIEGTAKGIGKMLKQEITRGFFGKIGALLSKGNLKRFKGRLAPEEIGGAMIYGLKGVVVKAQGSSKSVGFYNGIRQAALIVRSGVLSKVQAIIESDVE